MASACVNNIGMSPDNFLDCPPPKFPSYAWLSPRVSLSRDKPEPDSSNLPVVMPHCADHPSPKPDPEPSAADFEFRLEDPVAMLPADELFSDGKLVPLQLSSVKPSSTSETTFPEMRSPETAKAGRITDISGMDPYLFSPKAPRCSSRWKELLGLKKLYQSTNGVKGETQKTTSSSNTNKSLKHFLHRSSRSSSSSSDNASLSLPLLKDSDCESVSISSRLSLSSSSSGHEHEDLPSLSVDSDKPNANPISIHRNPNPAHPKVRFVKPRAGSFDNNQRPLVEHHTGTRVGRSPIRRAPGDSGGISSRGVSVDSPRMNSSGKIVFQSLERSSSSPSSFNGGPRFKHRGMERSYSANVRVTPVLNVPVCSLRGSSKSGSVFGFGQLFSSPQKREGAGINGGSNRGHQHNGTRHRCDRN
ncbi:serine/arginine repetitive matrix-like protein [Senna tora]|uniref:Serine/arginine repetitive matrix-like protein n=1 Tax=Senna tora TaxID=362788 RepID=A0A834WGG8_9FABA|nr:serine/arginine repetitive matrix-like protein [Senna tora]